MANVINFLFILIFLIIIRSIGICINRYEKKKCAIEDGAEKLNNVLLLKDQKIK
jgi:Na+-transporting methylmalonyl-CoA/oxaloacetate decarboxylase gamma subunit